MFRRREPLRGRLQPKLAKQAYSYHYHRLLLLPSKTGVCDCTFRRFEPLRGRLQPNLAKQAHSSSSIRSCVTADTVSGATVPTVRGRILSRALSKNNINNINNANDKQ
jgi:hypothetical protein